MIRSPFTDRLAASLLAAAATILLHGPARGDWILPPDDLTVIDAVLGARQGRVISTDGSGGVHAVWVETFSGGLYSGVERVFYNKKATGGAWGDTPFVITFTNTAFQLRSPSVFAVTDGRVHVVWEQITSGNFDIYHRLYEPGPGWGGVTNVSLDADNSINARVVGDLAGNAYVTWLDQTNFQLLSKKFTFGVGWDVSATRLDSTGNVTSSGDLAIDQDGRVYAAWQEAIGGASEVVSRTRSQSGSWDSILTPVSPVDGTFSGNPTLTVDSNGDVHAAYMDTRNGGNQLFHRRNLGGSGWEPMDRMVGVSPSNTPQLAADSVGGVHLLWLNESPNDLKYRRWSGSWDFTASDSIVTIQPDETINSNNASSIAATPWGTPQVAYQVGPTFTRKFYFEEQPDGLRETGLASVPPDIESSIRRFGSTDTAGTYTFDTPDPATVRKAILVFSYANFNYLVDPAAPHPVVGRNQAVFHTRVDGVIVDGIATVDTSFKRREIDITNALSDPDSLRLRFARVSGTDDFLIVLPVITLWDTLGTTVSVLPEGATLSSIALQPAIPNPFSSGAVLRFELPRTADRVSLDVYNVQGRRVASLLSGDRRVAGLHSVPWNGRGANGERLPSGVYYYRLTVDGQPVGTQQVVRIE